MGLLETLHFNVAVDAGFSVRLIIKAFRWILSYGDGVSSLIGGG